MATIIQHNISAMNANRILNINSVEMQKTTEKLSSGYRINRAADDAAGLAISEKMRSQIRGLSRAENNVQEGISFCQVADGAMVEMDSMVHRMRELSVQAANGTYTDDDREKINDEMEQLVEEIDRIISDTEFNTLPVFSDGVYDNDLGYTIAELPATPENLQYITRITDVVGAGKASPTGVITKSTHIDSGSVTTDPTSLTKYSDFYSAVIDFSGLGTDYTANELIGCGLTTSCGHGCGTSYNIFFTDKKMTSTVNGANFSFSSKGNTVSISINITNIKTGAELTKAITTAAQNSPYFTNHWHQVAYDSKNPATLYLYDNTGTSNGGQYPSYQDYAFSDDNVIVARVPNTPDPDDLSHGKLWIQAGANEGQGFYINQPFVTLERLKFTNVDVTTQPKAQEMITTCTDALFIINKERSMVGASQNRCEHAYAIDTITHENTQASESRLRDADISEEMVKQAKSSLLMQTGQQMLSQANSSLNNILSLLNQ